MIRVAIIGTRGIPANYGGFETLAEHLTLNNPSNIEYTVYCSSKAYKTNLKEYNNAKLYYLPLDANGVQSIPYDLWSIIHAMRTSDVLLILGVSGCITLPLIKLFTKKPLIINIDGLEWKRDKWGYLAKWFNKLSEKVAVKNGDIIISDNKVIQNYILKSYEKSSVFIPYGADHVNQKRLSDELTQKYPVLKEKYVFKVCRIEPENNVHIILEAFKETQVNLVLIGNWQKSKYGQQLFEEYYGIENIFLLDPIYDLNILDQFRSNCLFYVHGHSAGGTNPSLVEAMYLGLPIIAFDIDYNRSTTHNQALYFKNKSELLEIVNNRHTFDNLTELGNTMRNIAEKEYLWKKISNEYVKLYQNTLQK